MKRREFIAGLGSAAAWPLGARTQEAPRSVVGWIALAPVELSRIQHDAVLRGLAETGFVAGQNRTFEYHSVDYRLDRLAKVAAELVRRRVSVLGAGSLAAALAAKDATQKLPIVFVMGANPVERGIVPSLARPGANITGVTNLNNELIAKRLEILHELVPSATLVALLVNPTGPLTEFEMTSTRATAAVLGLRLQIVSAAVPGELEEAFAQVTQSRAGALLISGDALFLTHDAEIVALTSRIGVPTIYAYREVTEAGGLLSYGTDLGDPYRIAGNYVGRILKGEKTGGSARPALNLKAATALGITFPTSLLVRADEVIE